MGRWVIEVGGAEGTLYAGETYQLQVDFPEHYPMEAPQVNSSPIFFPLMVMVMKVALAPCTLSYLISVLVLLCCFNLILLDQLENNPAPISRSFSSTRRRCTRTFTATGTSA